MEQIADEAKEPDLMDFGWKTLLRYDQYISATNAKAGFILALDGAIVTLTANWLSLAPSNKFLTCLWPVATTILLVSTSTTILITLLVVSPKLKSRQDLPLGNSRIFFGDVGRRSNTEFTKTMLESSSDDLRDDLLNQVHEVGRILKEKFRLMKWAFGILIYCQIPLMLVMSALKILA